MKLICHIGTPKTASTFLQFTCQANAEFLKNHGVIYADLKAPSPNHITLFYASAIKAHPFSRDFGVSSEEDVKRLREELSQSIAAQIASAPWAHTMVMSSENLAGNLNNSRAIQNLYDLVAPHFDEVEILVYLRRQDEAILSMYAEFMRRGFSGKTFEEFIDWVIGPVRHIPYLYCRRLLNSWSKVFGEDAMNVRLFDRAHLRDGDIVKDFLTEVIGEDEPIDFARLAQSEQDNTALSAPALEFLRVMHSVIPRRKSGVLNAERVALETRIDALPKEPRSRMSKAQSERIMAHYQAVNSWAQTKYFPDLPGPIFEPRSNLPDASNLGDISLQDFSTFLDIIRS